MILILNLNAIKIIVHHGKDLKETEDWINQQISNEMIFFLMIQKKYI